MMAVKMLMVLCLISVLLEPFALVKAEKSKPPQCATQQKLNSSAIAGYKKEKIT